MLSEQCGKLEGGSEAKGQIGREADTMGGLLSFFLSFSPHTDTMVRLTVQLNV